MKYLTLNVELDESSALANRKGLRLNRKLAVTFKVRAPRYIRFAFMTNKLGKINTQTYNPSHCVYFALTFNSSFNKICSLRFYFLTVMVVAVYDIVLRQCFTTLHTVLHRPGSRWPRRFGKVLSASVFLP